LALLRAWFWGEQENYGLNTSNIGYCLDLEPMMQQSFLLQVKTLPAG
jgi:hypothetical protein